METTATSSSRMQSLIVLYDMQTTFFNNAIDGINDQDAQNRLNTKANHIAWLVGSLVEQRYSLAKELGTEQQQQAHELFKDGKGIQDNMAYPPLAGFKADWKTISPITRKALTDATDEKLDTQIEMGGMKCSCMN